MDSELNALAEQVAESLAERQWMLATAESCTGGWIAQALTAIAGSSVWFERGLVTYSNAAKQELLGVSADTLKTYGAVSEEAAREMASGILARSRAQVALSVTGIAGPTGGTAAKPVGTVCFAWVIADVAMESQTLWFEGDREAVRRQSVIAALKGLLQRL